MTTPRKLLVSLLLCAALGGCAHAAALTAQDVELARLCRNVADADAALTASAGSRAAFEARFAAARRYNDAAKEAGVPEGLPTSLSLAGPVFAEDCGSRP